MSWDDKGERIRDYADAKRELADRWVPACGGLEAPFLYNGTRWIYVFNFARESHLYLNLDTDTVHLTYKP